MLLDPELRDLVARVGAFHITDRTLRRAQRAAEAALRNGELGAAARDEYLRAALRYFESFDREARAQLRDVDRRLEHVNQIRFNLTAERAVAVRRIEATRAVLDALSALGTAKS
jgi:hypothetical protein